MDMKSLIFCALFLVLAEICGASAAQAQTSKLFGDLFWRPSHWRDQDFIPYYENGTDPHNTQWNDDQLARGTWSPEQWVSWNKGNGLGLIQRWYTADILRDQMIDDGVPVLVVGPNFYHLSGYDKRRIIQTIDHVYAVTSVKPRMFYLQDWATDRHIGYYSPAGLVLQ
jgi:hypothetical protein